MSLGLSYRNHITPALGALHWLPICEHFHFKLALLMYKACTNSSIRPYYSSSMAAPLDIRWKVCCPWHVSCLWPAVIFCRRSLSGIPYHFMSTILSPRLFFTLNSGRAEEIVIITRLQYVLLNFVRRALSNFSCIV